MYNLEYLKNYIKISKPLSAFSYVLTKILGYALLIFIITSVVFFVLNLSPGANKLDTLEISETKREELNKFYGFDKPLYNQFLIFWKNIFTSFSFGVSIVREGQDVNEFIWRKIGMTMIITGFAFLFAIFMTFISILLIALKPNGLFDSIFKFLIPILIAIPSFMIALIIMISITSLKGSYIPFPFEKTDYITWIFPILAIGIPIWIYWVNYIRIEIISSLKDQNIKFANIKGLSTRRAIFSHTLKKSIVPIISQLPLIFTAAIISTNIVEAIFSIPGLGLVYADSISNKDYNVILSVVFVVAIINVVAYTLKDIIQVIIDPRIRRRA
jgi:oligopeptide transport system permease protein